MTMMLIDSQNKRNAGASARFRGRKPRSFRMPALPAIQYAPSQLPDPEEAQRQEMMDPANQISQTSNHILGDYQRQMMLLEQQNKKRLMLARREQDGQTIPPQENCTLPELGVTGAKTRPNMPDHAEASLSQVPSSPSAIHRESENHATPHPVEMISSRTSPVNIDQQGGSPEPRKVGDKQPLQYAKREFAATEVVEDYGRDKRGQQSEAGLIPKHHSRNVEPPPLLHMQMQSPKHRYPQSSPLQHNESHQQPLADQELASDSRTSEYSSQTSHLDRFSLAPQMLPHIVPKFPEITHEEREQDQPVESDRKKKRGRSSKEEHEQRLAKVDFQDRVAPHTSRKRHRALSKGIEMKMSLSTPQSLDPIEKKQLQLESTPDRNAAEYTPQIGLTQSRQQPIYQSYPVFHQTDEKSTPISLAPAPLISQPYGTYLRPQHLRVICRQTDPSVSQAGIQTSSSNASSSASSNRATSATHQYINFTSGVSSSPFATHTALQTSIWPQDPTINIHANSVGKDIHSWQSQPDFTRVHYSAPSNPLGSLGTSHASTFSSGPVSRPSIYQNSTYQQDHQQTLLPRVGMSQSYPSQYSEVPEQATPARRHATHNESSSPVFPPDSVLQLSYSWESLNGLTTMDMTATAAENNDPVCMPSTDNMTPDHGEKAPLSGNISTSTRGEEAVVGGKNPENDREEASKVVDRLLALWTFVDTSAPVVSAEPLGSFLQTV